MKGSFCFNNRDYCLDYSSHCIADKINIIDGFIVHFFFFKVLSLITFVEATRHERLEKKKHWALNPIGSHPNVKLWVLAFHFPPIERKIIKGSENTDGGPLIWSLHNFILVSFFKKNYPEEFVKLEYLTLWSKFTKLM